MRFCLDLLIGRAAVLEGCSMKLCPRCKGEGCLSDYPGYWYPCEPCGEVGKVNDDGSRIRYTDEDDAEKSPPRLDTATARFPIAVSDQPMSFINAGI